MKRKNRITKLCAVLLAAVFLAAGTLGCGSAAGRTTARQTPSATKTATGTATAKPQTSPKPTEMSAIDLTKGYAAGPVTGKSADETFLAQAADLSLKLFRNGIKENKNSLVSPVSILLALAMTANGADNNTLLQMESLLGGSISMETLNAYLYDFVEGLPDTEKAKLGIANSIWFRDDANRLTVEPAFLQTNADYYRAAVYKADFNAAETVGEINGWVKEKTDGMIDKIIDQIEEDTVMYLINAVVFDAEWKKTYNIDEIAEGNFRQADGTMKAVPFMSSDESIYIDDRTGKAIGFIKPYVGEAYCFVALLPDEGTDVDSYAASLTGERFRALIGSASQDSVRATVPKFSYAYEIKLNDPLKALGMPDAFDAQAADFTRLGRSTRGNIFIGEVLHKTFIAVDEMGTRAGAVTKVEMKDESYTEMKIVKLDRPFVYAIVDNATSLPLFIGTMQSVE